MQCVHQGPEWWMAPQVPEAEPRASPRSHDSQVKIKRVDLVTPKGKILQSYDCEL